MALRAAVVWLLVLASLPLAFLALGSWVGVNGIAPEIRFSPPTWAHPLGTDELGRSVLGRTAYALGNGLVFAYTACLATVLVALIVGLWLGSTQSRLARASGEAVISLVLAVPFVLWAISLTLAFDAHDLGLAIIVACVAWPAPARILQTEVSKLWHSSFVLAELAHGICRRKIILRSILPLAVPTFLTQMVAMLPEFLTVDVVLTFFGLGAYPPTPTIGRLIFDGFTLFDHAPWMFAAPTILVVLVMLLIYWPFLQFQHARSSREVN